LETKSTPDVPSDTNAVPGFTTPTPQAEAALSPLARRYALLRFGPAPAPAELRDFLRAARSFRAPPAS
jgi:hypothetical protein